MINFLRKREKSPSGDRSRCLQVMKRAHSRRHALGMILVVLLAAAKIYAQSNVGELRLKVTDPAGLGVKSSVELVSEVNQFRSTYSTDAGGNLEAKLLPFGIYQIHVARPGLAPFADSLEIRSAIPVVYHVKLVLALTTTAVVVSSQPTLIDPYRVGEINRIGSQTLQERESSIPGRSVVDLVNSQPGWLYEGNAVLHPRGSEYQTQFVVDGVPLTDNRSPSFGSAIEANDVQSLSIFTANFPAQYDRKMGGVVEISTLKDSRPGWHGKVMVVACPFSSRGPWKARSHHTVLRSSLVLIWPAAVYGPSFP